nr:ADP-ribosyltransferase [Mammaliicoccus sp. Marseille-Q6498]
MKDMNLVMEDLSYYKKNVIIYSQKSLFQELTDHAIKWSKKLSDEEITDIARYALHDYKIINQYLYNENINMSNSEKFKLQGRISNIYNALSKFNFYLPLKLYRGINRFEYLNLINNTKFCVFKSFKSTSIEEDIALEFINDYSCGYVIIVNVPPYTNGAFIAPLVDLQDEKEYLINIGTEYKILQEYLKNGIKYIEIEVKSYDN